ncbi:MAG TPA: M20/M25/M40 family metallo-hydrolase [Gemmatimonadales bacterium]|nr:M20/M25/M40 family metallo-hydrolase [Gemmatimonadales bacterium]
MTSRALALSLGLALMAAVPLAAQRGAAPDFDALADEAARLLGEYLRIPTVNPPGRETEGARWLQAVLRREGIEAEILESAPGRGNLYARLRGTGRKRPIVLLSHIDVVPAVPARWTVDPFAGAVRDGHVWGRGALDMKGQAVVQLVTLLALKRRGVPLSRDVIFIANADEETGSTGADWFTTHRAELVRDAEFLINEGGENRLGADGRTVYYGVAVTEKVPCWVRLTARGTPGHGSRPTPDNPVARIARALGRIAAYETPLQVTPPVRQFFRDLAAREADPRRRAWLADPDAALRDPAAVAFFTSDLYFNAILRNTISITGMTGSNKTNVIPPEASAELDIRLLPGVDPAAFLAELRRVIADDSIEVTRLSPDRRATSSPLEGPLIDAIRRAVEALEPGALVTTPMLTGYTDSYYYRRLGIAAYGLEPFRLTEADDRGVHGNDERVSLANLRFGVEFFYRVVEDVAR